MDKLRIYFALTGSYCTYKKIFPVMERLCKESVVVPLFSNNSAETDSRFGKAEEFIEKAERICNSKAIITIADAEPIGPQKAADVLLIAPCTGNTVAKLANGIADTTVTLAAKSQLRNNRPVVIAVSTNDGLGGNAANIGKLLARKNIYLVPFGQDDWREKENSLVADFDLIPDTIDAALEKRQLQPVLKQ